MKNLLYIILLISFNSISQDNKWTYPKLEPTFYDTLVTIEDNGDTLIELIPIPWLGPGVLINGVDTIQPKWNSCNKKGVELRFITYGSCKKDFHPELQINNRIISTEKKDDELNVEVQVSESCGYHFGGYVDFKEDSLLFYYGNFAIEKLFCGACCYNIIYNIKTLKNFNHFYLNQNRIEISEERFVTTEPKVIIEFGDTIGYTDKYGLKTGWYPYLKKDNFYRYWEYGHIIGAKQFNSKNELIYEECHEENSLLISEHYNSDRLTKIIYLYKFSETTEIMFHENGNLKSVIYSKENKVVSEKIYSIKGKLIK